MKYEYSIEDCKMVLEGEPKEIIEILEYRAKLNELDSEKVKHSFEINENCNTSLDATNALKDYTLSLYLKSGREIKVIAKLPSERVENGESLFELLIENIPDTDSNITIRFDLADSNGFIEVNYKQIESIELLKYRTRKNNL